MGQGIPGCQASGRSPWRDREPRYARSDAPAARSATVGGGSGRPMTRQGPEVTTRRGTRVRVARSLDELEPFREAWARLQGRQFATDPDVFLSSSPGSRRRCVPTWSRSSAGAKSRRSCSAGSRIFGSRHASATGPSTRRASARSPSSTAVSLATSAARAPRSCSPRSAAPSRAAKSTSCASATSTPAPAPSGGRRHAEHPARARRPGHCPSGACGPELVRRVPGLALAQYAQERDALPSTAREALGDRLSLRIFRGASEGDRVFTDLGIVARKTYQHALGVAFAQRQLERRIVTLLMERGWFRAYVLYLDGEPISFWHGHAYQASLPGCPATTPRTPISGRELRPLPAHRGDLCADDAVVPDSAGATRNTSAACRRGADSSRTCTCSPLRPRAARRTSRAARCSRRSPACGASSPAPR